MSLLKYLLLMVVIFFNHFAFAKNYLNLTLENGVVPNEVKKNIYKLVGSFDAQYSAFFSDKTGKVTVD